MDLVFLTSKIPHLLSHNSSVGKFIWWITFGFNCRSILVRYQCFQSDFVCQFVSCNGRVLGDKKCRCVFFSLQNKIRAAPFISEGVSTKTSEKIKSKLFSGLPAISHVVSYAVRKDTPSPHLHPEQTIMSYRGEKRGGFFYYVIILWGIV